MCHCGSSSKQSILGCGYTLPCGSCDGISTGLLLIRLALAVIFLYFGLQKFLNLEATMDFFGKIGLAPFFVYLVAAVETLGGLAMLLGVYTALAGVALAVVMAVAIALVTGQLGFSGEGYAFNLILLLTALGIAFAGPGKYALCRCEEDKKKTPDETTRT